MSSPDDILTGKCTACNHVVEVQRSEARQPAKQIGQSLTYGTQFGSFDDLPSCECPRCLANSKMTNPTGTRILLRQKARTLCVCGHPYSSHVGHTYKLGEKEPHHCSQGCGCHDYEAREERK